MTTDLPSRRAVMADVAAQAGVSVMTVSRVLNGFAGVAEETRLRVEEAVVALGYQANTAARVLAGGRSRTLGVMAVETEQFGPSHMLFGIEAAAREAGHLLSFVTLSRSGNDMASTLHRLRASHVQGVIVVAPVEARRRGRRPDSKATCPSSWWGAIRPSARRPSRSTSSRGPASPPDTCSTSGTARSITSPVPRAGSMPPPACAGWSEALRTYPTERGTSIARRLGRRQGLRRGHAPGP